MKRIIQTTDDGSRTLYVPEMDEHYHSTKGALTESEHIFINMGLKCSEANPVRVLEIGFGTGLNAFLTLLETEQLNKPVHYSSIELYPLELEMLRVLDYPKVVDRGHEEEYYRLHEAPWNQDAVITPQFTLHKIEGDFTSYPFAAEAYDVIYFDAFAPEKQPEMWSEELFAKLYASLREGGLLTTYCAKGVVRRTMQACGFRMERLPGPPGGKREILRARKESKTID